MTPAARLSAVIELLEEIERTPRPADAIVSAYFRARRFIGSHDRGALSAMLYAMLRHQARLGWQIEQCKSEPGARTRMIAWLMLAEKKKPDEVAALFSASATSKFAPAPLSGDEAALIKKLVGRTLDHPAMPEGVRAECPTFALESLKQRFGAAFGREMQALLEPAPLDLRVNPLKSTREKILAELKAANIDASPCSLSPFGIRVKNRPALTALPMLREGRVEIQDEGSQLVAAAVDAKPGMQVVDFCAGAGGKTLAIAAQMNNKGRVVACDVLAARLKRSTERFRRAGLHNIETRALSSARDPWIKKHRAKFDRVLVDAPCSGVGAWRRNVDSRWRTEPEAYFPALGPGLVALLPLQADILDSAARLVKPGGRLIYATCSLLPEENEQQAEKFLASHADFALLPQAGGDYLSLTPAQHDTDGFFAAVMERRAVISETAAQVSPETA